MFKCLYNIKYKILYSNCSENVLIVVNCSHIKIKKQTQLKCAFGIVCRRCYFHNMHPICLGKIGIGKSFSGHKSPGEEAFSYDIQHPL